LRSNPTKIKVSKRVDNWIQIGDTLSVTHFSLLRQDLHIGENVPIRILMNNKQCKQRLEKCRATLKQIVTYKVGSESESYTKTIVKQYCKGANMKENKLTELILHIPSKQNNKQKPILPVTSHE